VVGKIEDYEPPYNEQCSTWQAEGTEGIEFIMKKLMLCAGDEG
jgi:hypothetical protein